MLALADRGLGGEFVHLVSLRPQDQACGVRVISTPLSQVFECVGSVPRRGALER